MNAQADSIRDVATPLTGSAFDYKELLERASDADFVLLGEATHGTHEFYRERAAITRLLIEEKGFNAVAVEADWPDAYRVNRFVRGEGADVEPADALDGFKRFPQWMWRNADVLDFIGWLREHNASQKSNERKTGFYGLDLYSLHASMEAVLAYLERNDPDAAGRARERYSCFDHFNGDSQRYGFATSLGTSPTCEQEVLDELTELRLRQFEYLSRDGRVAADEFFSAEQNAVVARNAEQYYRTMFRGEVSSWNLRDTHMMETLVSLVAHLGKFVRPVKVVVWAHNSHLGDARATQMGEQGELNLGQLVRERYGHKALLVGFSTHHGSVTAASEWDGPAEHKLVRPALRASYEELFHEVELPAFWLEFEKHPSIALDLRGARSERAIGVIYQPESERLSHYFTAHLPEQFDAILHFDETRAVEPLERNPEWEEGHVEETFPSGL